MEQGHKMIFIALIGLYVATASSQYNYPIPVPKLQFDYSVYPEVYPGPSVVGPSPTIYNVQYPPYVSRVNLPLVPAYTTIIKKLDTAIDVVKRDLTMSSDRLLLLRTARNGILNNDPPFVQYVTILTAVNELIDKVVEMGIEAYPVIYISTVTNAIIQTSKNPKTAAEIIRSKIDRTNRQIAQLRVLIKKKQQTECSVTISRECDEIISAAIDQTNNPLLIKEAALLTALGYEVNLFVNNYAAEFVHVSKSRGAAAYLVVDGKEHLKPLVMAGVHARKISQEIPPEIGRMLVESFQRNNQFFNNATLAEVSNHTSTRL